VLNQLIYNAKALSTAVNVLHCQCYRTFFSVTKQGTPLANVRLGGKIRRGQTALLVAGLRVAKKK
jgi:hypothetical protein